MNTGTREDIEKLIKKEKSSLVGNVNDLTNEADKLNYKMLLEDIKGVEEIHGLIRLTAIIQRIKELNKNGDINGVTS